MVGELVVELEKQGSQPVFEMLFSLKDDPGENNNRINDPEVKERLVALRRSCDAGLANLLKLRADYAKHYKKL